MELACTQSPFFQNLPYESTASVPNQNKDIEFWLSAHIVRAYPYMELTNLSAGSEYADNQNRLNSII